MSGKLTVKVIPGSSRNALAGWYGDDMKIRVTAAPEKGKANDAVLKLLATILKLPLSALAVTSGLTSAHKTISVHGLTQIELLARLPQRPGS